MFAGMMCVDCVDFASFERGGGGIHSGTLQRLFSNTTVVWDALGVTRYPRKVGSSLFPAAKFTLNATFRGTTRDNVFSLVSSRTNVVPRDVS